MFKKIFPLIVLMVLLLSACAPARTPSVAEQAPLGGAPALPAQPPSTGQGKTTGDFAANRGNADQQATDRLVIRNADLSIVTDDPAASMDAITRMATGMGGFVVSSNLYKSTLDDSTEVQNAKITVRVPADKLDTALSQIKGLTKDPKKDVLSENVTGQDVTKEYTDLNSQVKNLQETEAQLREIMKSAQKTEDVLTVYNQISEIHGQIEVLQGQINYYKEAAAMSAINVNITPTAAIQPLEIGGWQPVGVARDALQALINVLQFLGSAVIWILILIVPVVVIIFIPLRILWWLLRRNAKKPPIQAPPAVPPATAG